MSVLTYALVLVSIPCLLMASSLFQAQKNPAGTNQDWVLICFVMSLKSQLTPASFGIG
ncbi:hypothetical protein [uncultured Paraglaciecola sp.]|uniref:hypothetical protein n=1 Tax=uncultured Paraglaciecola sp. TaxID=1765024 RepID=UPI0026146305|nr:hypothetical protein [uncultured Paraglaciecola sp.]